MHGQLEFLFWKILAMREFIDGYWWHRKYCWLPHRCNLSNDWMWLEYAYYGSRTTSTNCIWHSALEHQKWKAKIKLNTVELYDLNF